MRKRLLLLVLGLALLVISVVSAQDNDAPVQDYTFRPIEDIVDHDIEVTDFRPDGTATLPIITNIPVACSVIWGETTDFGSLSIDQNMAGGAIEDHNPILSGLEPETTYYFRVQGTAQDGVVYLSETMTFTTPAFNASDVDNLASPLRGAEIVDYSSAFGDAAPDETWGINRAFDDNPNTEWSTAGDGDDAFVTVRLAQPAQLNEVTYTTRAMSDGTAITNAFTVTTGAGETFGPFDVDQAVEVNIYPIDVTAQELTFRLTDTTGGNTGAVDIGVFGQFIDE
ncbi:MAG: discoidin domain-containing protein [Anaerolineales bacterium]